MPKMSMNARREYLIQLKPRYLKLSKKDKGLFLTEASETTGLNKNY